jgi:hypothetical protein
MRNLALSVAAILVLAIASPAFAQPFADVPTDHWAFDAIAELAAKGIIEGFPDGTFKGDRGVSRYEVAIIVARILARIEAIKIPAPAPAAAPQVTRTDVQTIQRLVNEFRAELAALGVRTTAVEEELTALKAKSTNVTIKGDVRLRYNLSALAAPSFTTAQYRHRLTFAGRASPTVSVTTRIRTVNTANSASSTQISPLTSPTLWQVLSFDYAYTDVSGVFGTNWRLGQMPYTLGGSGWSGYGLLYDPNNADVFSVVGVAAGAKITGSLVGFNYELGAFSEAAASGFNIYTLGVNLGSLIPGWSLAVNGLYQARNSSVGVPTTAAGAGSGALAASTANTNDTGYEAILTGNVFPGLTLGLDYAGFNPGGVAGAVSAASSNAYTGWVAFDASAMMAGTTLTAWYKNYGSTSAVQMPFHTGAATEIGDYGAVAWNFNGFGAAVDTKFGSNWTGTFSYESGNQTTTGGSTVQEYYGSLGYALTTGATLEFKYFNWKLGGVDQANFYRVQFTTSY